MNTGQDDQVGLVRRDLLGERGVPRGRSGCLLQREDEGRHRVALGAAEPLDVGPVGADGHDLRA